MKLLDPWMGARPLKQLYEGAESRAKAMGDSTTGAEHLLLSAFDLPDGLARRAFQRAGGDPDAFEAAVVQQHDDALRNIGIEPVAEETLRRRPRRGGPKPNESLIHVLKAGVTLEKTEGLKGLGAQIVAGTASLEHGTAARTIAAMGIDRFQLGAAARAEAHDAA